MTYCIQETDSQIVYDSPTNFRREDSVYQSNETVAGTMESRFVAPSTPSSIVTLAWRFTHESANIDRITEANSLLSKIREVEHLYQQAGIDLGFLPPLEPFAAEDGSLLFEWIFNDFRVGFSIEPDSADSGWFLVTNKNLGEINASGFLQGVDQRTLIIWILNFITTHA